MKQSQKKPIKGLLLILFAALLFSGFFSSCGGSDKKGGTSAGGQDPAKNNPDSPKITPAAISATVIEEYNGGTTSASDSVYYTSPAGVATGERQGTTWKQNTSGGFYASLLDPSGTYVVGNSIEMEAEANSNSEVCCKIFNMAVNPMGNDPVLYTPTFTVEPLQSDNSIPVRIFTQNILGVKSHGTDYVQIQSMVGGVWTTVGGANGGLTMNTTGDPANYGTNLGQGTSYQIIINKGGALGAPQLATPFAFTTNLVANTTPASAGPPVVNPKMSGLAIYIRY
jgi:hypothetical protein